MANAGTSARSLHCRALTYRARCRRGGSRVPRRDPMSVRERPQGERPRERLLERGPAALSDAELVALLLRTGTAGSSALDVARGLIGRFGGVAGLLAAPAAEVAAVRGVGPAKCAELAAVVELARRSLTEEARSVRRARLAAGGSRLPAAPACGAAVRGVRRAVPRQPEPAAGAPTSSFAARWHRRASIRARSSRRRSRGTRPR